MRCNLIPRFSTGLFSYKNKYHLSQSVYRYSAKKELIYTYTLYGVMLFPCPAVSCCNNCKEDVLVSDVHRVTQSQIKKTSLQELSAIVGSHPDLCQSLGFLRVCPYLFDLLDLDTASTQSPTRPQNLIGTLIGRLSKCPATEAVYFLFFPILYGLLFKFFPSSPSLFLHWSNFFLLLSLPVCSPLHS